MADAPVSPKRAAARRPATRIASLLLVAACTTAFASVATASVLQQRREAELARFVSQFVGRFADGERELTVIPVYAPLFGRQVLYVEETVAGDAAAPVVRRLWAFDLGRRGQWVQRVLEFTDPARWRDGLASPQLFTGLQPPDVGGSACDLVWRRERSGATVASALPGCRLAAPAIVTGARLDAASIFLVVQGGPEIRLERRR